MQYAPQAQDFVQNALGHFALGQFRKREVAPVAMSAYYLLGVAPKGIYLNQIFRGMYPFMAIQLLAMAILWFVPDLANALPRILFDIQ